MVLITIENARSSSPPLYRLSGVLLASEPSPRDNIESLKNSLKGYFLDDSLDEVSLDLSFKNFAIPALLTILHDFVSST